MVFLIYITFDVSASHSKNNDTKALKCKTLGADIAHAQYMYTGMHLLRLMTIYLHLTFVGNGRQIIANNELKKLTWPCESEKQAN